MNAKNLMLKLAFVALITLLCVLSVYSTGLREGIDLRGGHSLIFEIRTNQVEIEKRQQELDQKKVELAATQDPARIADIKKEIASLDEAIKTLSKNQDSPDLPDEMIKILKGRVDPQGLMNLEWRPIKPNRIEVRMPVGSAESRQAREAYAKALERLAAGNLTQSQLYRVATLQGPQRAAEVASIAAGNAPLAEQLTRYAATNDQLVAARQRLEDLQKASSSATTAPGAELAKAQDDFRNADTAVVEQREALLKGNITRAAIEAVLANDLSPAEIANIKSRDELERRQELFGMQMDKLLKEHPSRTRQIDDVRAAYESWAKVRQRLDDPSDLQRLIAGAGVLEFRIAPYAPGRDFSITKDEQDRYTRVLREEGPDALRRVTDKFRWFPVHSTEEHFSGLVTGFDAVGKEYVLLYNLGGYELLHKRVDEGGWSLKDARVGSDQMGRPAVDFEFDENGSKLFGDMTANHKDHCMAILLDDQVYSAPVIQTRITSRGQITGSFSLDEVKDLVSTLKAGSLPARLNPNPVAINNFGATLGEENLKAALRSGVYATIAIVAFMLIYYMFAGTIANVALAMNIILVLGVMSAVNAVFTLPGIAGMILTVGMAVDANVLIYERLREEQRKSLSVRMAIKNAYDRAFSAILDCHVTTISTCLILIWLGTEEIKGFGITLGLGVVFNFFTAVFVTRWIFQLFLERGWLARPVRMLHVPTPTVNWMGKRYYFWAFSAITGILGLWALFAQGQGVFGIEFSSGTQAIITFKDDALINGQLPNDGLVYNLFFQKAQALGDEKLTSTARVETVSTNRVSNFLRDHAKANPNQITRAEWVAQGLNPQFFDLLAAKAKAAGGVLTADELDKALPAKSYQVATTETNVHLIQQVAAEAFGNSLEQRQRLDFDFLHDAVEPHLKVPLSPDGYTRIDAALTNAADPQYRDELLDAEGGALFVVKLQTPVSAAEINQRISEMRFQPDSKVSSNSSQVIGLTPAGGDKYSEFAILSIPGNVTAAQWKGFAANEQDMIQKAMHRQEAMLATNFDAAIAGKTTEQAVMAIVLSWVVMIIYLWIRFGQARWGLAAVICLIHDVVIAVGMVAASAWLSTTTVGRALGIENFKIDLAMIAAFLTIVGYSVNDTIVVFDRIRENRGKLTTVTPHVINAAINQTLSRTLLTSSTVLLVCLVMYIWGGPGIHAFNYAMLIGVASGTYSSIAVASPILLGFKEMIVTHVVESPKEPPDRPAGPQT